MCACSLLVSHTVDTNMAAAHGVLVGAPTAHPEVVNRDALASEALLIQSLLFPLQALTASVAPAKETIAQCFSTLAKHRGWAALVVEGCQLVLQWSDRSDVTSNRIRLALGDAGGVATLLTIAKAWEDKRQRSDVLCTCLLALATLCGDWQPAQRYPANIRRFVKEGGGDQLGRLLSGPACTDLAVAEAALAMCWRLCCTGESTAPVARHTGAVVALMTRHGDVMTIAQYCVWVVHHLAVADNNRAALVPHVDQLVRCMQRHAAVTEIVDPVLRTLAAILSGTTTTAAVRAITAHVGAAATLAVQHVDSRAVSDAFLAFMSFATASADGKAAVVAHVHVVAATMARHAHAPPIARVGMECLYNLVRVDEYRSRLAPHADVVVAVLLAHGGDAFVVTLGLKFLVGVVAVDGGPEALLPHVDTVVSLLGRHMASGADLVESALGFLLGECAAPANIPVVLRHVGVVATALSRYPDNQNIHMVGLTVMDYLAASKDAFVAVLLADEGVTRDLCLAVNRCRPGSRMAWGRRQGKLAAAIAAVDGALRAKYGVA